MREREREGAGPAWQSQSLCSLISAVTSIIFAIICPLNANHRIRTIFKPLHKSLPTKRWESLETTLEATYHIWWDFPHSHHCNVCIITQMSTGRQFIKPSKILIEQHIAEVTCTHLIDNPGLACQFFHLLALWFRGPSHLTSLSLSNNMWHIGLLGELNNIMHVKDLRACLAYDKHLIKSVFSSSSCELVFLNNQCKKNH